MKKNIKRALSTAIMAVLLCTGTIYAKESDEGTIMIELGSEGQKSGVEGIWFSCIKVAEYADGEYTLKPEYQNSAIDFNKIDTAARLSDAAEKLAGYDHTDTILQATDSKGIAKFKNLSAGMYLIEAKDNPKYDDVSPALVSVPTWNDTEKNMCFNVAVKPKHSPRQAEKKITTAKTGIDDSVEYYLLAVVSAAFIGIISGAGLKNHHFR